MDLKDIISLARAGYKKKDIDELLQVQVDEPEPDPVPDNSTEPDTAPEGGDGASPEDDEPETQPDYEKLYNDTKKELENTKSQLAAAQKANVKNNNASGDPTPDETVNDIFRQFM